MTPTELTTRYATTVDTLPEAWAFVMAHIDDVGTEAPRITINPIHGTERTFDVSVSGMQELDEGETA